MDMDIGIGDADNFKYLRMNREISFGHSNIKLSNLLYAGESYRSPWLNLEIHTFIPKPGTRCRGKTVLPLVLSYKKYKKQ